MTISLGSEPAPRIHLSPREARVLPMLMQGMSSKEIARELEISPRTVDIYRSSILAKLRIRKTTQIHVAMQNAKFDSFLAA